ncbi:hypothetical protein LINGRAHAP2_LOCUS1954 [Linum grandiflorum]
MMKSFFRYYSEISNLMADPTTLKIKGWEIFIFNILPNAIEENTSGNSFLQINLHNKTRKFSTSRGKSWKPNPYHHSCWKI